MQGASSDVFIREAMRLMHERGYRLGNLDATIIAEVCDGLQATTRAGPCGAHHVVVFTCAAGLLM